jgi:uncharacterized protein
MSDLLTYILKAVVKHPEEVRLEEVVDGINVTINLYLNNEDKPLVIGKLGRNIKAIRDVVALIAIREGKKLYIKIVD